MAKGEVFDVVIVGAGISGIGMAAHLADRCPGKSYAVLDRRAELGGTWDLFRYPGIRSDSDMYTLGFRFAPWRDEETIASGTRIRAYLRRVVEERDIARHMHFGQHVRAADWDSSAGLWRLEVAQTDGTTKQIAGRFLYMGTGYYDYDDPFKAEIPGLAAFKGAVIHPQFWPADFDYSGKRVVVIGSGATAVTLVPALTDKAAHVTMLQRTPSWMLSRPAKDHLANWLRQWLPEKWAYALVRLRNVRMQEFLFKRARAKPAAVGKFLKAKLQKELGSAWDEAAFSPPYGPWEQRLCLVPDGDLFKAIRAGKASIATGVIGTVQVDAVLLKDGSRIAADVIVTATGLNLATLGKVAVSIDGTLLNFADHYYYRDAMFSNVPNFAALFGYLNAGWTLRVDIVADWICRLLMHMDAWGVHVATPALPAEHGLIDDSPFDLLASGYLARGSHLIPKSTTTAPWRICMDYRADKAELAGAPIDDGWMRFERLRKTVG